MSKDKINVPKASTLMGSLRSMGYTFESAVADVIDIVSVLMLQSLKYYFLLILSTQ